MYEAANDNAFAQWEALAGNDTLGHREHGTAATRGHCAGNGGLRGHSVGGTFPCVLFSMGNPHVPQGLSYWFKSPDSQDHGPFLSWEASESAAYAWLEYRAANQPVSFEPQVPV